MPDSKANIRAADHLGNNFLDRGEKVFTKDIPKAKVLTAGDVMHPAAGETPQGSAPADTPVEALLPALLVDARPLVVLDDEGVEVGVVDRAAVADMLEP